jgi:hypothetical protein
MKWHTRDSSEGEEGKNPTIFRDIYEGDERIAERVEFEAAHAIVSKHNQEITDQYADSLDEMSKELGKFKYSYLAPSGLANIFRHEARRIRT